MLRLVPIYGRLALLGMSGAAAACAPSDGQISLGEGNGSEAEPGAGGSDGAQVTDGGRASGGAAVGGDASGTETNGAAASGTAASGGGGTATGAPATGVDGEVTDFEPPESGGARGTLTIATETPELVVVVGDPAPSAQLEAQREGSPVAASWRVLQGEIGSVSDSGLFTPSGNVGGQVTIEASAGSEFGTFTLIVRLSREQNGAGSSVTATPIAVGGVGGEGEGAALDADEQGALGEAPTPDETLSLLYPYDGTVFPLGLLSPLLQWSPGTAGDYSALRLTIRSDYYDYTGTFGRPAALPEDAPFVRHPIPQDVWIEATRSNRGGSLDLELTLLGAAGAVGTLRVGLQIAGGSLRGTVYYQAYGTELADQNTYTRPEGGGVAGATLAIYPGQTAPELVAGGDGGAEDCRVCHSVSADGSRMIVQHGDYYAKSSNIDLGAGNVETQPYTDSLVAWIGMTADGRLGLTNAPATTSLGTPDNPYWNEGEPTAQLVDLETGEVVPSTGLEDFVTQAALPTFSADGRHVAFNLFQGPGTAVTGPGTGFQLVTMSFDGVNAFSEPELLWLGDDSPIDAAEKVRPGWPTFLPDAHGVVFNRNWGGTDPIADGVFTTWEGRRGDLQWVDLETKTAHALDAANGRSPDGTSYLPTLPTTNHTADESLSYEPSVSPIVSGGYAWMVFVSRRLYGNVATIDPWSSNPRYQRLTEEVTTKKLWVAAIDLDAEPGTDPSHPAFYLPAQELHGVNSRGFWVLEPCKDDGASCDGGDECCGGFCQEDAASGELVCGNDPPRCSNEFDLCSADADCCDSTLRCIAGRCATPSIR